MYQDHVRAHVERAAGTGPLLSPMNEHSIRAKVPQPYRELLRRYVVLLNAERRRRGQPAVSQTQVAGAMLCFLLDHQQQTILDDYEAQRVGTFREKFASLLGEDLPSNPSSSADGPLAPEVPDS